MPDPISSVQDYFDTLDNRFVSSAAKGVNAIYQFELSGDGGGIWHVVVNDGSYEAIEGAHDSPTTTFTMDAGNYVKMVNGELNGRVAALTRKLKVTGNRVMAFKLQKILPPNK